MASRPAVAVLQRPAREPCPAPRLLLSAVTSASLSSRSPGSAVHVTSQPRPSADGHHTVRYHCENDRRARMTRPSQGRLKPCRGCGEWTRDAAVRTEVKILILPNRPGRLPQRRLGPRRHGSRSPGVPTVMRGDAEAHRPSSTGTRGGMETVFSTATGVHILATVSDAHLDASVGSR